MVIKKRGQISTEYLIVVGFVTFLIISIMGLSLFYTSQIRDKVRFDQLQNFANKVISSSESVFYAGEPSRAVINAYLPAGVESIVISEGGMVFSVSSSSGLTVVEFQSQVPIYGSIGNLEGVKTISIVSNSTGIILGDS